MGDVRPRPPDPVPVPPAHAGAASVASATCVNHPDRRAIGRCPTCRKLVCDECHVRLDGILHCKGCLAAQARKLDERARGTLLPRIATTVAAVAAVLLALVAVRGALSSAGLLGGRATRLFATTFEAPKAERR